MASGLFAKTKEEGMQLEYGNMMDYFVTPVSKEDMVYGMLCLEESHAYYFNRISGYIHDLAVEKK